MKIEVIRKYRKESYTIGEMYVNEKYFCDTLNMSSSSGAGNRAPRSPHFEEIGEAWNCLLKEGGSL